MSVPDWVLARKRKYRQPLPVAASQWAKILDTEIPELAPWIWHPYPDTFFYANIGTENWPVHLNVFLTDIRKNDVRAKVKARLARTLRYFSGEFV